MMKLDTKINKQEDNTYKVNVKVSVNDVNIAYGEAVKHEAENAEIKGFRKGKAPINIVEKHIDSAKLRSHALNHLLTNIYKQIVTENKFQPILQPRFNVIEFDKGKNLVVDIVIIEKPTINLGKYKSAIAKIKPNEKGEIANQLIVNAVLESSDITVPDVLIDEEVNRMMSSLIDQTARLGLTIDQYLQSINKTPKVIRAEYKKTALSTLKADFLITEIAISEKITVDDDEIKKTISAIPDEKSREVLSKPEQMLYIKAILMKNKTLEKLKEEAVKSKIIVPNEKTKPREKSKQKGKKKQ